MKKSRKNKAFEKKPNKKSGNQFAKQKILLITAVLGAIEALIRIITLIADRLTK